MTWHSRHRQQWADHEGQAWLPVPPSLKSWCMMAVTGWPGWVTFRLPGRLGGGRLVLNPSKIPGSVSSLGLLSPSQN